jgi:hypothetical protein
MKTRLVMLGALAVLGTSCSSTSGASGTGSGGVGGTGSGGVGGGGSTAPARAGVTFTVEPVSPAVAGKACNTFGTTARVPAPPQASPTATMIGDWVSDGVDGAEVTCRVAPTSLGFDITASVRYGTAALSLTATTGSTGMGTGDVTLVGEFGPYASDPASRCTLVGLQIKPRAYWATFECDPVFDPASPDSTYCLADGVVTMQDCAL